MDYKIKKLKNSAVEIEVSFSEEDEKKYEKQALDEIRKSVKIKGFREGQAPDEKVIEEVGKESIMARKMEMAMQTVFYEIAVKENLQPVNQPKADLKSTEPLKVSFHVDLMPELPEINTEKIKVKPGKIKVEKKEIEAAISQIQRGKIEWKVVERGAKKGDRVEIDFEGFVEGVPFEGGQSKNHPLVLGSESFIPGFEEKLEGITAGEEKEIEVKFPEDYHHEPLKGKDVSFKVKVHHVAEEQVPEITDEFAKKATNGECNTVAELETKVEEVLTEQKNNLDRKRMQDEILQQLIKQAKIELPESMIEEESGYIKRMLEEDLKRRTMTLEQYYQMRKIDEAKFQEESKKEGENRLRVRMALHRLADQYKITVSDEELEKALEGQEIPADRSREDIKKNLTAEMRLQKAFKKLEEEVLQD